MVEDRFYRFFVFFNCKLETLSRVLGQSQTLTKILSKQFLVLIVGGEGHIHFQRYPRGCVICIVGSACGACYTELLTRQNMPTTLLTNQGNFD